jgi:hypothetical protein
MKKTKKTATKTVAVAFTKAEVAKLLASHQAALKSIKKEVQDLRKQSKIKRSGKALKVRKDLKKVLLEEDTIEIQEHELAFIADGLGNNTGTGFLTAIHANFDYGVISRGNKVGVVGLSSADLEIGDTIGVRGVASSSPGTGLQGIGYQGATAVEGIADTGGTGVQGNSDTGIGVQGFSRGVGVVGFGFIGVQGSSDSIGVLGGNPAGLDPNMFAGVVGQGPTDPSGSSFSYGGWFGRGVGIQGGTAPIHLEPATAGDPNPPQAAQRGDLFVDHNGVLFFCTDTGDANPTPATWKQVQLV